MGDIDDPLDLDDPRGVHVYMDLRGQIYATSLSSFEYGERRFTASMERQTASIFSTDDSLLTYEQTSSDEETHVPVPMRATRVSEIFFKLLFFVLGLLCA